jgi:hypothetical protein
MSVRVEWSDGTESKYPGGHTVSPWAEDPSVSFSVTDANGNVVTLLNRNYVKAVSVSRSE